MKVRRIKSAGVERAVKELSVKANIMLRKDVYDAIDKLEKGTLKNERSAVMTKVLIENAKIAREEKMPICQDTGIVTVFVELGRNVVIEGKNLEKAINDGVASAYKEFFFRSSVVKDPITRIPSKTNTPVFIHTDIVDRDSLKITVMPKGFGSENKTKLKMFDPTVKEKEIIDFCVGTVREAGPDACPPYILGIGLGGTPDACLFLAKKALLRPITKRNKKTHIKRMEQEIFKKANALKIGVMGLGGGGTVIGVNIETLPTHIAGLPVAVNISCHALRSASAVL